MTFEQWREGEQWNDHCNPTDFAKAAWDAATKECDDWCKTVAESADKQWDYQQKRIDELEQWVAAIADDHPQIPDWIQQSANSILTQGPKL